MKFLAPQWLWAVLAVPVAYWFFVAEDKRRKLRLSRFISPKLWDAVIPEFDPSARLRKGRVVLLAVAFAFLALARPQWGAHEETVHVSGLDIMLALDVSNSMEVEDVAPSRLKKARHLIKTLLDRLQGDRVGIVAFASSAYVACPLTTDLDYVLEQVQILGPRMVLNQGTDVGTGLDTARKALERGAEEVAKAPGTEGTSSQIVVLISDGEDHEEAAVQMAQQFRKSGIKLFVLGVGTEKGGPVPVRDDAGALHGYKKDRSGQPVVSSFRPDALIEVAAAGGGRYWNITPDEGEVMELLNEMGALNKTDYAERRYLVYEERYQYPLAIAILLLFWEFGIPLRRRSALAGAKSLALVLMAAGGLSGCLPSASNYAENEKGREAFNEGKIDEAKKHFGQAQAHDPNSPELKFNQGAVQAQEGDLDGAMRGFSEAARDAMGKHDDRLTGQALYNLGGLLTKKGDIKGALGAYLGALERAKSAKDESLENDTRKNIELLIKQQQQQQQKNQQQKQDQQKEQQQKQDQQKEQQQKQDQQKQDQPKQDEQQKQDQQKKQEPQQYEDTSKRKQNFRSLKLSDEDAERVMAELKNKERELQKKLKKQNGRAQGNQKDW